MLVFQCVGLLCMLAPTVGEWLVSLAKWSWRKVRGPAPADRFAAVVFQVMRKVRGAGGWCSRPL